MATSLTKLRQDTNDDIGIAYIKRAAVLEDTLRKVDVEPSDIPMRPNYGRLTPHARFEASIKHTEKLAAVTSKQSQECTKLIGELSAAIVRVVQTPLWGINSETIDALSEAESKKALGLAVKNMFYQAKQILIILGEKTADAHFMEPFVRQRDNWENLAKEVEQELQQRSGEGDQISALEKDVAKCSAEVCELRAFMKTLSKKLHTTATGTAKLPKELRKCEKSAMASSVERILSVVKAGRDAVKELQTKLRDADAEKHEQQLADTQLHDQMEDLRRQLIEAAAEKVDKESEIEELMEKRLRCSVCMDREKDTVFVCGHAYCNGCASEWRKCTVCVAEKGNRPITFRHPLFL